MAQPISHTPLLAIISHDDMRSVVLHPCNIAAVLLCDPVTNGHINNWLNTAPLQNILMPPHQEVFLGPCMLAAPQHTKPQTPPTMPAKWLSQPLIAPASSSLPVSLPSSAEPSVCCTWHRPGSCMLVWAPCPAQVAQAWSGSSWHA
jgi:hypothetical protein